MAWPGRPCERKGQLTLPEEIRKAAHLVEGDMLEAELIDEGILLRPQKVIDASQAWFWTTEWQEGEREADAQLAASEGETFESGEKILEALQALEKPAVAGARARRFAYIPVAPAISG